VRVNVQLIRAANDSHLWAETYDRKLTDIFAVETEIAKAIAENLAAKLTHTEERAVSVKPTNNLAAYELYLQGRYFWNRRDREGFRRAIELFTKATELDPNYALAYVGIADTYALLPIYGFASARDSFPKAKVAALRALQLDDTLAEAHASYGNVLLSDFDWVRSRREFERAIELNPNYATAHQWLGSDNLMDSGELDRGLAEVRRARELDPLSPIVNTVLAIAHYSRREYADAVTQFHKTFEIDPNFLLAHAMLGQTLVMQGAIDEGIAEVQKARQINGDVGLLSILGYAYARKGDREQALKILDQMKAESQKEFVPAVDFAILYIGLGNKEQALDWLEKGYEDRSSNIIKVDPICDPLHGDPRYESLVARIFSEKPAGADF
jgi:tetratricopeptide (TPR) repeat protein